MFHINLYISYWTLNACREFPRKLRSDVYFGSTTSISPISHHVCRGHNRFLVQYEKGNSDGCGRSNPTIILEWFERFEWYENVQDSNWCLRQSDDIYCEWNGLFHWDFNHPAVVVNPPTQCPEWRREDTLAAGSRTQRTWNWSMYLALYRQYQRL